MSYTGEGRPTLPLCHPLPSPFPRLSGASSSQISPPSGRCLWRGTRCRSSPITSSWHRRARETPFPRPPSLGLSPIPSPHFLVPPAPSPRTFNSSPPRLRLDGPPPTPTLCSPRSCPTPGPRVLSDRPSPSRCPGSRTCLCGTTTLTTAGRSSWARLCPHCTAATAPWSRSTWASTASGTRAPATSRT